MSPSPKHTIHAAALALTGVALLASPVASPAEREAPRADAQIRLDPARDAAGAGIPSHFVGVSVEWSLVERYMGSHARRGFANLLANLGTGLLRIGGGSQDLMRFDPTGANTNRVITPEDLAAVRATLGAADATDDVSRAPSWGVILGTAMAPRTPARRWVGPENARAFIRQGVGPAFRGVAKRYLAGIELGNEPDVSYGSDADRYLKDFTSYAGPRVKGRLAVVGPNTSETIAPWNDEARRTRSFWDRPRVIDTLATAMTANRSAFGAFASSHFYPTARKCSMDAYRCATIARLLSDERMANFGAAVYAHARAAARNGVGYRVEELNSASGRGVRGVSEVAASAVWALDTMFNAACPQPPAAPAANAGCGTGAIGVNFHNAEVGDFFRAEQGNAHYNALRYDVTNSGGAPTAAPEYYALLLFARFAQGTSGLRPVTVTARLPDGADVKAWRVHAGGHGRRLFLINKGRHGATVEVAAPGSAFELDRMTPHDPTGANRTLDAPAVRIDGREVSPDGTWAGFQPKLGRIASGRFQLTVGAGEAAVVTIHG